jgi:hypothetical protein
MASPTRFFQQQDCAPTLDPEDTELTFPPLNFSSDPFHNIAITKQATISCDHPIFGFEMKLLATHISVSLHLTLVLLPSAVPSVLPPTNSLEPMSLPLMTALSSAPKTPSVVYYTSYALLILLPNLLSSP